MPERVGERKGTSQQNYDLQLKIKDLDYSGDLTSLRIVSSLSSVYQIITLTLLVEPNDIITEGLFGQDPITLNIRLLGQDGYETEQLDFELMYISGDMDIPMKSAIISGTYKNQGEKGIFKLITVCRKPFKTMTSFVNEIYEGTTVRSAIQDLVSDLGATIEYDSEGENKEVIDQILIPPTTLYKTINYLDETFGLFDGVHTTFCQYDNKIYIKNLSKRINKNQIFTVDHLATDINNADIVKKSTSGKNFYSYFPIKTDFISNSKFAVLGKNIKHITKPNDTLYHVINQDLETICKDYGLIYKNKKIHVDVNISGRTRYFTDKTGYNKTESFANAQIGKEISNMAFAKIRLAQNLPILNLINVGDTVKLNTQTVEYVDLSGKYILHSSDLSFWRERDWQTLAEINLVRTNRTI